MLKGLLIDGVPKNLKGTIFPFRYNNFEELENIVKKNNIGTIKMEVKREVEPNKGYLQKIRKLCNKKGIVLIFDECTSGFKKHTVDYINFMELILISQFSERP